MHLISGTLQELCGLIYAKVISLGAEMPNLDLNEKIDSYIIAASKVQVLLGLHELMQMREEGEAQLRATENSQSSAIFNGNADHKVSIELIYMPDDTLSVKDLKTKVSMLQTMLQNLDAEISKARAEVVKQALDRAGLLPLKLEESKAYSRLTADLPKELQERLNILEERRARTDLLRLCQEIKQTDLAVAENVSTLVNKINAIINSVYDPLLQKNDPLFRVPVTVPEPLDIPNLTDDNNDKNTITARATMTAATGVTRRVGGVMSLLYQPLKSVGTYIKDGNWSKLAFSVGIGAIAAVASVLLVVITAPATIGAAIVAGVAGAYLGLSATEVVNEIFAKASNNTAQAAKMQMVEESTDIPNITEVPEIIFENSAVQKLNLLEPTLAKQIQTHYDKIAELLKSRIENAQDNYNELDPNEARELRAEVRDLNLNWQKIKTAVANIDTKNLYSKEVTTFCENLYTILQKEYHSKRDELRKYKERERKNVYFNDPKMVINQPAENSSQNEAKLKAAELKELGEMADILRKIQSKGNRLTALDI